MSENHDFLHHVGDEHPFVARGLRNYFEYRDLGIEDASKGDVVSHVIRAREVYWQITYTGSRFRSVVATIRA